MQQLKASKRPSFLWWSQIEKWTSTSDLLRFGRLPEGWRLVLVSDFATLIDNKEKVEPEKKYQMAGVKWYGEGVFRRETVKGNEQSANYLYPLRPKAIIYNRLFAWKESFAVVPEEFTDLYVSNEFPQFEIDKHIALPEYIYLLFTSKKLIKAVNAASVGSSAVSRNRFKESDFLNFKVPIPPLYTQQKILEYWKKAIIHQLELENKEKELVKECHTYILNALGIEKSKTKSIGKMFCLHWNKEERWSYEYNKRVLSGLSSVLTGLYTAKPLAELCLGQSGSTPSKKNPIYWRSGTLPWVSPKDMKNREIHDAIDHISEKAIEDRQAPIIPSGSIIFVVRSGILQKKVPIAVTKKEVSINQDIRSFTPKTSKLLPDFLLAYLETKQKDLLNLVKWSTTVQSINKEELESFPVPIPPLIVQQSIISEVDKFQNAIKKNKECCKLSTITTKKTIQKLILGTLPLEEI